VTAQQTASSHHCRRTGNCGALPSHCNAGSSRRRIGDVLLNKNPTQMPTQVQALQKSLSAGRSDGDGAGAGAGAEQRGRKKAFRRTMAHKQYSHPRRPNVKLQKQAAEAAATAAAAPDGSDGDAAEYQSPTSRAMRRRPGQLRAAAEQSCAGDAVGGRQDALPRKLETHVWHAKRMHMQERWARPAAGPPALSHIVLLNMRNHRSMRHQPCGMLALHTMNRLACMALNRASCDWASKPVVMTSTSWRPCRRWGHMLPEGQMGKGRGDRHTLKLLHSGCLLHDASYGRPLQLAGGRDELAALLGAIS